MDRNRNGVIEREEWNGSRRSFTVHDWNGDGILSGEEVRVGGRRRAIPSSENDFDPLSTGTWTESEFRQLDRNRDNRVTSNEWYYQAEAFRRADRNRDGALSLAEFTSNDMDDDREDLFVNLDANRNGRIERREWHGSLDAFQWLDRDRNNVLSRAEVVGDGSTGFDTFSNLDADRSGTLAVNEWYWSRASFNRYDTNRDGILTRREFAAGGGAPTGSR
jgi:Ca2+-binding EF-hand superfamily protein